ncbi:N-acetylmuramoyl-L-alanine amidase [Amphibacillus cookii]|uniref:N-acetylmuramoyl-L-alanine amidase n=1 Tax=Amphibacillus cookii TaxID=767787 RepID=UPI00195E6E19|nr:N-acetylmuramoyl-L-alanine amidase [Amphibacillus cookii]MBM7540775.1 N-acetylmuramoyl-L-alanine amidase [Amphibacillus cookii]
MVKIFIDPGHGGSDPGAVANGLSEKNLTLAIGLALRDYILKNYQNVSVRMSRTSDQTVSLNSRTQMANQWEPDFYLSIHVNAGGGSGFESYIWNGQFSNKSRTQQIRSTIHQTIVNTKNWRDRGQKEANFHVLRETRMTAVLTENGFIDHQSEARAMRDDNWVENVAIAHAHGIEKAFQLKRQNNESADDLLYRVVVGSFREEQNARSRVNALKKTSYEAYILPYDQQGQRYYRVIAGAFHQKQNAENRLDSLKNDGFEGFLVVV